MSLVIPIRQPNNGGFDFYVAPGGNDANPGTLQAPWAFTAINSHQATYSGKRVGLIAGTYDLSGHMVVTNEVVFSINGGSSASVPTYIASCDVNGNYSQGVATLDFKGASGIYGGVSGSTCYPIGGGSGGVGPNPANMGNWTIDGVQFTGFGFNCITIGNIGGDPTPPGAVQNVIIKNCTFHDGISAQTTTHSAVIIGYDYQNVLISNCWFHNCTNPTADAQHYSTINFNGQSNRSQNATVEFCTFTNSPGIYGIVDQGLQTGNTVRYCYFDFTTAAGNFADLEMLKGMSNTLNPSTQLPSFFHHNILRGGIALMQCVFSGDPWVVNCQFYNNTWDMHGANIEHGFGATCNTGLNRLFQNYNNLFWDNGATLQGIANAGYIVSNVDAFSVLDYNIYGSLNQFGEYAANGGAIVGKISFAAWKTATGQEAHSTTNTVNPFTNNGILALQYQVQAGSPAFQTGKVGGVSTGATCNVGAWDGTVTQIGCSFATS